ncbi:MAG: hypothetical protein ACRC18_06520 [Cetobacterium sp.]
MIVNVETSIGELNIRIEGIDSNINRIEDVIRTASSMYNEINIEDYDTTFIEILDVGLENTNYKIISTYKNIVSLKKNNIYYEYDLSNDIDECRPNIIKEIDTINTIDSGEKCYIHIDMISKNYIEAKIEYVS